MKRRLHLNQSVLTLVLGITSATVLTAYAVPTAQLPPEHKVDTVAYVSGGIGEDEAAAMKQAAPRYPLELTFVAKAEDGHDMYLAGTEVTVRDHSGRIVLYDHADGPFLLAKLPPGRYTVEAIDHGQIRQRSVTLIPDKHAHLVFEW